MEKSPREGGLAPTRCRKLFTDSFHADAGAAILDELVAADGDWDRIDKLSITGDLSPAEAIAMVLTRDRKLAMRMLHRWTRAHGYS